MVHTLFTPTIRGVSTTLRGSRLKEVLRKLDVNLMHFLKKKAVFLSAVMTEKSLIDRVFFSDTIKLFGNFMKD